jgi:subfamily B ATP-binding cassette protein MsbA
VLPKILVETDFFAVSWLKHKQLVLHFRDVMVVRVWHYVVPLVLSVASAGFDAVALALLVPLAQGLAEGDFGLVWDLPVFRNLESLWLTTPWAQQAPNRSTFVLLVILIFGSTLTRVAVAYVVGLFSSYRNGIYSRRARQRVFQRFVSFGKLYFDRTSQGVVATYLGYSEVILGVLAAFEGVVRTVFRLGAHLVVMVTISLPMTLVAFVVFPLLYALSTWIIGRVRVLATEATDQRVEMGRKVFGMLSSVGLMKSYCQEEAAAHRYWEFLERLRWLDVRQKAWATLIDPLKTAIVFASLGAMTLAAAFFADSDHTAELSTFCAFLLIARQTVPMFGVIDRLRTSLAEAAPRLERLAEVFEDDDKFFVQSGPQEFTGMHQAIEMHDLDYAYDDRVPVLQGLSARFEAGRVTALVGPTGCGKTTVLSLIARMYECPAGTITVDGVDIRELSLPSWRSHLAVVSQETWLFDDTLRDNLAFGLERDVTDEELREVCEAAQLSELLEKLPEGFDTLLGDRGVCLSGGEKQRVAIARALLKNADIFLLDEATASLDTRTELEVQRCLEQVLPGRTAIIVAHRLSTIRNADRILVMDEGRVVEEGSWPELIAARGAFHALWEAQTQGAEGGPDVAVARDSQTQ